MAVAEQGTETPPAEPVGLSPEVAKGISALIAEQLAPFRALATQKATSNMSGMPEGTSTEDDGAAAGEDFRVIRDVTQGAGLGVARFVKAIAAARLSGSLSPGRVAEQWAERNKNNSHGKSYRAIAKALNQSTVTEGGILVPETFINDVIEYLRTVTTVRRAGARVLPFTGSAAIPRQTGAATAYWGEESAAITPSQQTFGGERLTEKKLTALVPMSNDWLRNASIPAEEMVRSDLFQVIGETEDLAFLRSVGTVSSPRGIRYAAHADHIYAATQAGATATLAEVRTERSKVIRKMKDAKIPMLNCAWLMTPRTEQFLASIVDGNGNAIYEEELGKGTWGGFPVFVTTQIPDNLGGSTNESELYFGDFAQAIIGEAMGLAIEVFPNATYEEGGSVKSGISRDQSVVRAIEKVDFALRHSKAFVVVTTLKWGA